MERLRIPVGDGLVLDALTTGPPGGEPVVLLHGFPQDAHCWRGVWPGLAEAGYRVVAPDLRGYSPDARPSDPAAYGMTPLVADAAAVVDALGGSAHIVGHDWGAAISWQLAGRRPDRVRTLTALSVPHPRAFREALLKDADQQRRSRYMRDWKSDDTEASMLDGGLAQAFGGLPEVDTDHYVTRLSEPGALTAALSYYRVQSRADLDGLGAVTAPTLYVWSDGDVALGRTGAELTESHVDGPYRFEVLEGVSHWIPEQAADRITALLLDHLRS